MHFQYSVPVLCMRCSSNWRARQCATTQMIRLAWAVHNRRPATVRIQSPTPDVPCLLVGWPGCSPLRYRYFCFGLPVRTYSVLFDGLAVRRSSPLLLLLLLLCCAVCAVYAPSLSAARHYVCFCFGFGSVWLGFCTARMYGHCLVQLLQLNFSSVRLPIDARSSSSRQAASPVHFVQFQSQFSSCKAIFTGSRAQFPLSSIQYPVQVSEQRFGPRRVKQKHSDKAKYVRRYGHFSYDFCTLLAKSAFTLVVKLVGQALIFESSEIMCAQIYLFGYVFN